MAMRIVIAGGSGFLGTPLSHALSADQHRIILLTRGPAATGRVRWDPNGEVGDWAEAIDGADALINLSGESIAGTRWNDAHKSRVLNSRVLATRSLARAIRACAKPPRVLISGSGVGFYGSCGDEIVTETRGAGSDFLAGVCVEWEAEALAAQTTTRVVCVRTGLVLARDGGALAQMLTPFWFGAGGPVGSGRQYWPWIHRHDWIDIVRFAIANEKVDGAVNATGPAPVTNREFAKALGRAMHRPAFATVPGFVLRMVVGEMAYALLTGQRAIPEKTERAGFGFRYRTIEATLADLFR
jgi:uncharacterized protein (TIGR01777 family)